MKTKFLYLINSLFVASAITACSDNENQYVPRQPDALPKYRLNVLPAGQVDGGELGRYYLVIGRLRRNGNRCEVDGNVLRVISRLQGDYSDIKKASVKTAMEQEIAAVMPKDAASSYNQGLIEIGALVCIPGGEPRCRECPLESLCITKKKGLWKEIPVKSVPKPKRMEEKTVFLVEWKEKVAIHKRPPKGLLASLYELPNIEGHLTKEEAAEQIKSWIWEGDGKQEEKTTGITVEPLGTAKQSSESFQQIPQ